MTNFKASHLSPVMVAGITNARKSALQIGLSIACSTLVKGDALTSLEMAQLCGWTGDKAPSRKTGTAEEKTLAERVKKYMQDSRLVFAAMPNLTDTLKTMFTDLYGQTSAAKFATEADKVINNIKFFEGMIIENKSDLNELWLGFVDVSDETPEQTNIDEESDVSGKGTAKKVAADETSRRGAIALANDAIALLADDLPFLNALLAVADKQQSEPEKILTIVEGFKVEIDRINDEKLALELALENKEASSKKAA